eukprot:1138216-Pelagomonas_calceolata.AAC.1
MLTTTATTQATFSLPVPDGLSRTRTPRSGRFQQSYCSTSQPMGRVHATCMPRHAQHASYHRFQLPPANSVFSIKQQATYASREQNKTTENLYLYVPA